MSTQLFINKESVKYLMLNAGNYLLGDKLVKIQLKTPKIEGLNRKQLAASGKIATKENHAEIYGNEKSDAMLAYTLTIINPVTYTSHMHETLALQNKTAQEYTDVQEIFANNSSLELEQETFLGETIDHTAILGIIRDYARLGKKQKAANRWRISKKKYQLWALDPKDKEMKWRDYADVMTEKSAESAPTNEAENLAPNLAEIAAQVMNTQAPMPKRLTQDFTEDYKAKSRNKK